MKKNKALSVLLSTTLAFGISFTALSFPTDANAASTNNVELLAGDLYSKTVTVDVFYRKGQTPANTYSYDRNGYKGTLSLYSTKVEQAGLTATYKGTATCKAPCMMKK
ncbi:hypothetical protein PDK11_25175 [Bacillus cereus]|nr:hypothetical protein [Bacillus cereus]